MLLFMLLGLTGLPATAQGPQQELSDLSQDIAFLRTVVEGLEHPGTLVDFDQEECGLGNCQQDHGAWVLKDRKEFDRELAEQVRSGKLTAEEAQRVAAARERFKQLARELAARRLREKEARYAELTAGGADAFWRNHSGAVQGSFSLTCRTASGETPRTGRLTFTFAAGTVTLSGPGSGRGTVSGDGSTLGRPDASKGEETGWWGRFRQGSDGTISGRGDIAQQTAAARCDGTWSVP